MDELERRRQKLASPSNDMESIDQAEFDNLSDSDINKMKSDFQFEKKLEQAFAIEVPDDLADKILLQQTTTTKNNLFLFKPALSIAASVAIVAFIFIGMQTNKLADIALTHVYHELDHLVDSNSQINTQQILTDIQNLGLKLPNLPKNITYAGKCIIGKKQGMHIVARVNNNPVTLFLSSDKVDDIDGFSDNRFSGKIYPNQAGSIIVIGDSIHDIDALYQQTNAI